MRWYQELLQASQEATTNLLESARLTVLSDEQPLEPDADARLFPPSSPALSSSPSLPSSPYLTASAPVSPTSPHHTPASPVSPTDGSASADELPFISTSSPGPTSSPPLSTHSEGHLPEPSKPLLRPSEYLRRRCPLCFGSKVPHDPNAMCVLVILTIEHTILIHDM